MKKSVLRKLVATVLFGLMSLIISNDVYGLEKYVIGGEEHPWATSWTKSGSFELIDTTAASIQPLQLKPDENLVEGYKDRGGWDQDIPAGWVGWATHRCAVIFDGDSTTALESFFEYERSMLFPTINLGDQFYINKIVFFPRSKYPNRYVSRFALYVNDGKSESHNQYGTPLFTTAQLIREERENKDAVVVTEFPPRLARYVAIRPWQTKVWEIAELQVFGEGFVPRASYTSDIIDFKEIASWGKIRWSGMRDPDAKVIIQTRSGMDEDPNIYWRKTGMGDEIVNLSESGEPLRKKDYDRLRADVRGPVTYDSDNWSFWSAPYDFEDGLKGVPIISIGPRRYFQIKVDFIPTMTDGGKVDFIEFEFSKPPAAHRVVAEIFPLEVEPSKVITFTYTLKPTIVEDDTGFDSLEIMTPVEVNVVRSVRINGVDVSFTTELLDDPTRFVVHFPDDRIGAEDTGSLLEVEFDAVVLRYGTAFTGRVFDSQSDEVHQLVEAGDATDESDGDDLSVRISLGGPLTASVAAFPNPFTPNGDGFNDAVGISYSLLQLTHPAPVSVDVYDLSGTLIRRVYSGENPSGEYSRTWDGTDDYGRVVSPGIYIYRISVYADNGEENRVGTVAVVY